MKNTWLRYFRHLIQILIFTSVLQLSIGQECTFPESEVEPFFFDVKADLPVDSVIVDTAVDPPNATLQIVNVRSNNLPEIDFTEKFDIEQRARGQFMVLSRDTLQFPRYPSSVNETYLYMTVLCNNHAYPLITVRIRNFNSFSPKFYNEPYEVVLPGVSTINALVNTPLLALDSDPESAYPITYKIESGQYSDEFALITSRTDYHPIKALPKQFRNKLHWQPEQLPPIVKLHVQHQPRDHEYRLNISATDSGTPSKKTYATLRVIIGTTKSTEFLKFTQKEYFANFSKLMTVDTEIVPNTIILAEMTEQTPKRKRSRVMYELAESDYSDYFLLDHRTAQLTIRNKLTTDVPSTFTLIIKAFLESDMSSETTTTLTLADISDESLTYFSKCFYEVNVEENSYPDVLITRLQIHGKPDEISLLNGTDYFRVDSKGHLLTQKPLDREETESLTILVRLVDKDGKNYPQSNLCTTATIVVTVDDINDNSPKFEKTAYVFFIDENPYNNTEVGTIKAIDNDKSNFGKVHYRMLLDDPESVPFTLFESNNGATIYYVTKKDDEWPDKIYSFTAEAYDGGEEPRATRVGIQINLHEPPEGQDYDVSESRASHVLTQDQSLASSEASSDVSPQLQAEKVVTSTKSHRRKPTTTTTQSSIVINKKSSPKSIIRPMSEIKKTPEQFESDEYRFLVFGEIQEGQYVGTIRIANSKNDAIYELEAGIRGFFKIDSKTGHLYVDRRLLEDEYEEVRFSAIAKRNGNIVANTLVTVILDDTVSIYELTPRFEQSLYRFEINENQPPQHIGKIQAHHRAVEVDNDRMIYALHSNEDAKSFFIDQFTGEISSIEEFDREKQHLYKIGISGCLQSNSSSCDESEAVIVILDLNDNAPAFEENPYKVTISTDIDSQTELVTIKATDPDLGKNGQVRYQLLMDGNGNFKIDEVSGELYYIGEPGDLKVNRRFNLTVKASDSGVPPLSSETSITINVGGENHNPNAPEFTNFRYEVTLPANVPADFSILTVEASDADSGPDGEITYKISDNDAAKHDRIHQLFTIDPISGEILTKQALNANTDGPIIQFVVEAHDQSPMFPRKTETVVMLRFKERNAAKLEFVPLPKTVFISSEKPVGSEIIGISAKTVVEDDLHRIRYGVSVPEIADYFEVPSNTGSLRVKKPLIEGRFPVTLTAYIPGTRLNATHTMMIVVMTDRDKYPVFDKLSYEMKVPISAAFPVKLEPLNATLSTGHIEYGLYQAERLPAGISVDKVTGQLTVFEEFVSAFDGAGNVFVVIRARNVDWPTFYSDAGVTLVLSDTSTTLAFPAKLYRLVIPENKMQGTTLDPPIEIVNAQEIGSGVEYSVEPADSLFAINPRGELYLKKTVDLEELPPASQGIVEINVVAKHKGEKATTKVQIKVEDENEFTPVFLEDQYDFEVHQQPTDGQALGTIRAIDEDFTDKGKLRYQIVDRSGAASALVEILQNGTIVKKPGMKFENGIYDLIVEALDYVGHSTEVVVSFYVHIDGNETTPTPEPKEINKKWKVENDVLGAKFAIFGTPNRKWQFSIGEGNEDGIFALNEINETMAEVLFINEPNITATNRKLEVEVINVDNPRETIMTNVEIDLSNAVTSKAPQFLDTTDSIRLPSNFNPNAVILTVKASQRDGNGKLKYEIVNDKDGNFEINPTSGEVTFAQNDRPKLPGKYEVTIKATAPDVQHSTSYSTEKVYVVEILPFTENHSLSSTTVTESEQEILSTTQPEERPTEEIVTVPEVESPPTESEFENPTTEVEEVPTVANSAPTETIFEETDPIPTDGESPLTDITETDLELTPTDITSLSFEKPTYEFNIENPRRGSKVGEIQLRGSHLSSNLQMIITPPEMEEIFRVDSETHEIFLKKVPENSQESQEFLFNITVFNVENPQEQSQTEISVAMMPFLIVTPSSASNEKTMFPSSSTTSLEPLSTMESPANSEIPDNEAPSAKPIEATSTSISTTDGIIDIRFSTTQFTAMLPEATYSNGIVTLKPNPLNKGMPKGVVYSIDFSTTMKNESFPFSIREEDGVIYVFGKIDRELTDFYEFIVVATYKKGEEDEVSDSALVQVQILDVNDNDPEFINAPHVIALSMDTRAQSVIANFTVIDRDEDSFGTVSLSLEGEFKEFFAIDTNGILTVAKELTPELGDKINLAVVASDGGRPNRKTEHMLAIELYSEAAQKPAFKETEYTATVSPNASLGQFVAQIVAGINKFNYAFENSYSNLFVVSDKGVITLGRNPLKTERNKQYLLNLTATDGTGDSSTTSLNVSLEDLAVPQIPTSAITPIKGDPKCEFTKKVYNSEIRENTVEKTLLAKVETTCKFLPENSHVQYVIHQGPREFEINEKTGELFVNAPLNLENRTLHFIIVNFTIAIPQELDVNVRSSRKSDAIIEYARSKLAENQALVIVKVLDDNDNEPQFTRTNSKNEYVFLVDWQLPLKTIGRIQATDADVTSNISYTFSEPSEYFSLNSTTGVINLIKSLENAEKEVYDYEVVAFDGKYSVKTHAKIYPLMPGVNVIILTVNNPEDQINEVAVSRELTQALEMDTRVLVKRVYTNEENVINRAKSFLLIYSLRKETHEPIPAAELKEKLEKVLPQLQASPHLHIESISLPPVASKLQMTNGDIMLLAAAGILFLATCIAFIFCLRFCKRRASIEKAEGEYMVDAESNGPRPYNVELISRRTAQNVLAGRELPNPFEEVKMSSQSRASLLTSSGMLFNDGQLDRSLPSLYSASHHESADSRSTPHHQPQASA